MMSDTSKNSTSISSDIERQINPALFHDFLTTKIPFEKQVDNQFERISGYGSRNDPSVSEVSNQFSGNKRIHSNMGSSRDGVAPDGSNLMKMFRNASGGERPRLSPYDRPLHGSPQNRPVSPSFMMQQTARTFSNLPKCERSISTSSHYNPRVEQGSPVVYQMPPSRFKEGASCPTVFSQLAADEGSRTGNKNSGILKSLNPGNGLVSERNVSGLVPSGCNVNHTASTFEPESSSSLGRHGLKSSTGQMTIIFGGQLHVFDDVNPSKADVIMALAGSSGGSWSTALTKSSVREPTSGGCLPTRDTRTSSFGDRSLPLKNESKLFGGGNFIHALGSPSSNKGEMISKTREISGQAAEFSLEPKQEAWR